MQHRVRGITTDITQHVTDQTSYLYSSRGESVRSASVRIKKARGSGRWEGQQISKHMLSIIFPSGSTL
jgi:hypothetical protein